MNEATALEIIRETQETLEDKTLTSKEVSKRLEERYELLEAMALHREAFAEIFAVAASIISKQGMNSALTYLPTPIELPPLDTLTTTEAARILAVSTPTVRRLAKRGKLKHIMVGTHMRFTRDEIERYKRGLLGLGEVLDFSAELHEAGEDEDLFEHYNVEDP